MTGVTRPIIKISIGKNFPNLCFLNVKNAINAAICKKYTNYIKKDFIPNATYKMYKH